MGCTCCDSHPVYDCEGATECLVRRERSQHLDYAARAGYDGRDVAPYLTGHAETEDDSAVPSDGEVRWAHMEGQALRLLNERALKVDAWRRERRALREARP
jgi:hypothetical protein